jgi:predicted O-methyltransferase YrrM
MEGQLFDVERKFLYDAVLGCLPTRALEIGTWKGGGSTFQIASALQLCGGILYTCELNREFYDQARASYAGHALEKHIIFHLLPSTAVINIMVGCDRVPEFVFFDGSEDPDENLNDFMLLDRHLVAGARFCAHDWDPGPSQKAVKLRPYLEQLPTWRIVRQLTAPESVGIVLAVKL